MTSFLTEEKDERAEPAARTRSRRQSLQIRLPEKGVETPEGVELKGRMSEAYASNPRQWWSDVLKGSRPIERGTGEGSVRVLDLFSSVGGLALGAKIAAELLGGGARFEGAVDTDRDALQVHATNLGTRRILDDSVRNLVDFRVAEDMGSGRKFLRYASLTPPAEPFTGITLLIGGPPCQGHSTLNNRTRSADTKNQLMLTMPAIAVAADVPAVVIENVPNVINDSKRVVETTRELFESHGYHVRQGVLSAHQLGWPQSRKRFFMIARRDREPLDLAVVAEAMRMDAQNVSWLLEDSLDNRVDGDGIMDSVPTMSEDNVRRVKWLFDNDAYELANHERPKCHQDGHTYPSVYGRMHWDEPAPTITGGFLTPGRGRFVHPLRKRVLTPREAARIQGFPDWYDFDSAAGDRLNRSMIAKWIGDAVPSILAATAVLSAIG